MKFAVVGVGGVGGYFGGLLARFGYDVTFVARGEQFRSLSSSGLTVNSVDGNFHLDRVKVVDSPSKIEADLVFVSSKTYDLAGIAAQLRQGQGSRAVIIPLQNGIDHDLRLKAELPEAEIYPGLVYIISARTAPGVIDQTAGPRTMFFGDRNSRDNPKLRQVEADLRAAGVLANYAPEIELELWNKFLWITTFGGTTAVCRSPIGTIVNDPNVFNWYVACLDEGIAVARACGIDITDKIRAKIIEKSEDYRKTGAQAKSSLLIDLELGRQTEIEALNGAMVRLARDHGVKVPIQESIYHAVRLGGRQSAVNCCK